MPVWDIGHLIENADKLPKNKLADPRKLRIKTHAPCLTHGSWFLRISPVRAWLLRRSRFLTPPRTIKASAQVPTRSRQGERSVDPKPQHSLQARQPRKNQPVALWRTPERRSKPRKRESESTVQHATAGTQSGCAKGFYAVRLKAARSLRLRANVVARRTRTRTKAEKQKVWEQECP